MIRLELNLVSPKNGVDKHEMAHESSHCDSVGHWSDMSRISCNKDEKLSNVKQIK